MSKDLNQEQIDSLLITAEDSDFSTGFNEALGFKEKKHLDKNNKKALIILAEWIISKAVIFKDSFSGNRNYLYILCSDITLFLDTIPLMKPEIKKMIIEWLEKNQTFEIKTGKRGVPLSLFLERITFILRSKF